jgi:hypothetical protein
MNRNFTKDFNFSKVPLSRQFAKVHIKVLKAFASFAKELCIIALDFFISTLENILIAPAFRILYQHQKASSLVNMTCTEHNDLLTQVIILLAKASRGTC